jgi:hypothetical protein
MGRGREPGHIDADLGDDGLRGPFPDPGDGVEPVTGPGKRDPDLAGVSGKHSVDPLVEPGNRRFEVGGVLQTHPISKA